MFRWEFSKSRRPHPPAPSPKRGEGELSILWKYGVLRKAERGSSLYSRKEEFSKKRREGVLLTMESGSSPKSKEGEFPV